MLPQIQGCLDAQFMAAQQRLPVVGARQQGSQGPRQPMHNRFVSAPLGDHLQNFPINQFKPPLGQLIAKPMKFSHTETSMGRYVAAPTWLDRRDDGSRAHGASLKLQIF
jgi:hypothetical protein